MKKKVFDQNQTLFGFDSLTQFIIRVVELILLLIVAAKIISHELSGLLSGLW